MVTLLVNLFVKNKENVSEPSVRSAYGTLCSIFGIFLNVLLFFGKLICGMISGSVAIIADSFNNLADAGSSVVTLFGFRLSEREPDPEHPFGHGRFEYISGLIVSFLIMLMGFELAKSSLDSIIHPEKVEYSPIALVILGVSVAVKLYMAFYNNSIGKRISSSAMKATAKDSLSDALSTSVILVIALVSPYLPFYIDGWAGMCVSLLIMWAGISAARDTITPLLGTNPDAEFVKDIENAVMSYPDVYGIHDLVVHDYGPGRLMISLHVEIPVSMDIGYAHDMIDNIEVALSQRFKCHTVIHMDPVDHSNPNTLELKERVSSIVKGLVSDGSIHDFRVVYGNTHTNLVFDILLPYTAEIKDTELCDMVKKRVKAYDPAINCVICVDKDYVGR